ncbi:MAG TPA: hypothetical protein VIF57_30885 [Polyangia bacterium]
MRQFTMAASVAALFLVGAGASPAFARGGKKGAGGDEMPASINQQFQWEDKVVGPKEGIDRDKLAATRERGVKEDQERKARGPEKVKRTVAEPSTASIPTQDIEKPAAPVERKKKMAATQAPRQRDALDNLLDEQGVKPNRPSGGSTGLDSVLASDDKGAKASGKKGKKAHRGRN